jgi:hypothetical protein
MHRKFFARAALTFVLLGDIGRASADVERAAAALDPSQYTIQFLDSNSLTPGPIPGTDTYIRFANMGATQATITAKLVGNASAVVYASVEVSLAPHATTQIRSRDLVQNLGHIQAYRENDVGFLLYLQSTGPRTSFDQVNFNSISGTLENFSQCEDFTPGYDYSWLRGVLPYIHTTTLAQYPFYINAFNPNDFPLQINLDVYKESGELLGSMKSTLAAHAYAVVTQSDNFLAPLSSGLSPADIQDAVGFKPAPNDFHMTLVSTVLTPGAAPPIYTRFLRNSAARDFAAFGHSCAIEH